MTYKRWTNRSLMKLQNSSSGSAPRFVGRVGTNVFVPDLPT